MKSFTAAAIISLIAAVSALPAAQTTPTGSTTEVTFCTDQDYQGTCTTETVIFDVCHQIPAPYHHNLGSMKVASGALCRLTYTAEACTLHGDIFVDPQGQSKLHNYQGPDGQFADAGSKAAAFTCTACSNCV